METIGGVGSVTPPILKGPTAKERKFDRQLRLWAASGQQALEEAHILLLNNGSGTVGVEATSAPLRSLMSTMSVRRTWASISSWKRRVWANQGQQSAVDC